MHQIVKHTIQWQMFIDCFHWDQQNGLQLHRKLTNEHLFPDSQLKMRNHLAEHVLNGEMLHLMKQYKNSLGEKGQVLNGAIELLENTSPIVSIFRDMRPICDQNDNRLQDLKVVADWFSNWEAYAMCDKKQKTKHLMSQQCHEDIQSCIRGFLLLCDGVSKSSTSFCFYYTRLDKLRCHRKCFQPTALNLQWGKQQPQCIAIQENH